MLPPRAHTCALLARRCYPRPILSSCTILLMIKKSTPLITDLRLEGSQIPRVTSGRRPPHHKPGGRFLKGPIPWPWLTRAASLPGKAIHVGLALWHLAGMKKSRTIKLTRGPLKELGVLKDSKRRALLALEREGLISVDCPPGSNLVVTLLDPPGTHCMGSGQRGDREDSLP